MPLSEHEERILAEIERGLTAEDPRFVERARRVASRDSSQRQARLAAVGFVVGMVSLLATTFSIVFGFVGFALMFTSVLVGARAIGRGGDGVGLAERIRRSLGDAEVTPKQEP